jgi:DNA-binding NtrC family response regulator
MKKKEATILIIDDDEDVLLSAKLLLKQKYTNIITRNSPAELNQLISTEDIDLIFLDMNYRLGFNDGKEGMYWLNHILSIKPDMVIILMTAYGEVDLAVRGMKNGAFDFILKPWSNDKFLATVNAGIELSRSHKKLNIAKGTNEVLKAEIEGSYGPIIGSSPVMQNILNAVSKVSPTMADVLILGENGTGKQHLAREIHRQSNLKDEVFIHVDLGALTESLFESELFGHKKGAFTDAKDDKLGRFELAQNGTIFLDEIGNLSLSLQSKLLTVLQDRKVTRLGEGIERAVNARMIFATNANLRAKVEDGTFREDLLYRINTIELEIPPLRTRPEDISEFVDYFLHQLKLKYNKPNMRISKDALAHLKAHRWPGNIRELQHTIERGVILAEGDEIKVNDFNLTASAATSTPIDDNLNLQDVEHRLVLKALDKHQGNISKAAKELGITRGALYRRMDKFSL